MESVSPAPQGIDLSPARLMRVAKQFIKFGIVGGINTAIDFGVLKALLMVTGITSGFELAVLNAISFSVAVVNSYFMNKRWTFEDKTRDPNESFKFSQFFVVSVIGLGVNSGIVYAFATFISPQFGISAQNWVLVGKLFATGASLVWNFVGYKLFVFRR